MNGENVIDATKKKSNRPPIHKYTSSRLMQIFVFVVVAVATSIAQEAARFPAGINPALCPDYPNCDNSLLHTGTPLAWSWNQGLWDASSLRAPSHLEINGPGGDR